MIDDKAREFFDEFEFGYSALSIDVRLNSTGEVHSCVTYMLENFREEILNPSSSIILFENYSSVNQYYPEYLKKQDCPDNQDGLGKRKDAYGELKN